MMLVLGRDPMVPRSVESDATESVPVGDDKVVHFYVDGTVRFEHRCDRKDRNAGVIVCAPALRIGNGHTIVERDPLTITPSILCPDCGTHGWVTGGRWRE